MPSASQSPTGTTSQGSILLLEEYDALAAAISSALRKFAPSHLTHVARSLVDAKALARKIDPDLFVIDFDPAFSGLTVFLQKMQELHPHAKVLIIAGKVPRQIVAEARSAGALQFVGKPFDVPEFGAAVQALLGPWTEPETATPRATLESLSLPDVLLAQCAGARTVALEIKNGAGRSGEILVREGRLSHAETGRKSGSDALRYMMTWRNIEIRERERPRSSGRSIEKDWTDLLIEAFREIKAKRPKPPPEKIVPPKTRPKTGKKIVVVDDTEMLLIFVDDVLMTTNPELQITMAPNAVTGIKEIERVKPDLVLLDYSLPDLNGDEVCRRLLQNSATAQIPVLMMSGHVLEMAKAAATLDNVVATIAKPFLSDALVSLVQQTLKEPRPVRKKPTPAKKQVSQRPPAPSPTVAPPPVAAKKSPPPAPIVAPPPVAAKKSPPPAPTAAPPPVAAKEPPPPAPIVATPPAAPPQPAPPPSPPPAPLPVIEPPPKQTTEIPPAPPIPEPPAPAPAPPSPSPAPAPTPTEAIPPIEEPTLPVEPAPVAAEKIEPVPPPVTPPPQPAKAKTAASRPPSPWPTAARLRAKLFPKPPRQVPEERVSKPPRHAAPAEQATESPKPAPPEVLEPIRPFEPGLISAPVMPMGAKDVVLGLFLDVVSVQLTPELRMGSIRARPSSLEVSLHVASPEIQAALPTTGFQLGRVGLDENGRITTLRLIPRREPFKAAQTRNALQIGGVAVIPIDSTTRVQLTPTADCRMTMHLFAHLELAGVELSPTFQVSQLVLKNRSNTVQVTLNPQAAGQESSGTKCETLAVNLNHSAQITELLLNPLR